MSISVEKPEQDTTELAKNELEEVDTVDVLDVEQATVDFLEKERLAVKKETDEYVPKMIEVSKHPMR